MTCSCRAICSLGLNICASSISDIEQGLVFAIKCENIQSKQKFTSFLKKKNQNVISLLLNNKLKYLLHKLL